MKGSPHRLAFYKQLGENIRKCRRGLNRSQDDLARSIGLTRTSLTNIENGRQHPPLHTFCDLLEQLDVAASELLPTRTKPSASVDVEAMAGQQVRGANELAFITTGIGMTNEEKLDGHKKKKNRSTRGDASS